MSTIWTMPGKLGDAILQFPVARQWSRQTGKKFTLWLDEKTLKPLERLFASQDCVECVEFKPGIASYHIGGQPWHFDLKTEDTLDHVVYHLGFRQFPDRQITLQTALDVPVHIDVKQLSQPALIIPDPLPGNRVVLHATFTTHQSGTPKFWRFLRDIKADLEEMFDEVIFVGTADERARAMELYPGGTCGPECVWGEFDDHGDFYELARLLAGSRLVIGPGSCGVALASVLGVPAIRVHDPIGEAPRIIWSGLGPNQWNEEEKDLRRLWPGIKEALKVPVASG
jgi:hypothetical protein